MSDVNIKDYLPHKYKVRQWEQSFNQKYGRRPSKHDIKDAPNDIKFAYKEYYKLKTNLLSNTLSDILTGDDENEDSFSFSANDLFANSINNSLYEERSEENNSNNNEAEIIKPEDEINKKAWGIKIPSPEKPVLKNVLIPKNSTKSVINTKGFSFNFSKRNPRSSLNLNNSQSSSSNLQSNHLEIKPKFESLLPDFETILAAKSQKNETEKLNLNNFMKSEEVPKLINNLDQRWINRCSGTQIEANESTNKLVEAELGILKNSYHREIQTQNNSEPKITEVEYNKCPSEPDSDGIVLNSEDESSKPVRHVRKKRKLMEKPKEEPVIEIKEIEVPEKKIKKPVAPKRATRGSKKNVKVIEELSDNEPEKEYEIEELNELDVEKKNITSNPRVSADELKKYSKIFTDFLKTDSQSCSSTTDSPIIENNAKKKLESKIASGQLNENFVRINIQKKVFVRGHKKVNYSRHKKTQWKQKRAAALAGPEMDMNGCDGGQLICHICNLPGHFARNCKAEKQADNLLPLDAEYSQYATLEEIFSACNDIEYHSAGDDDIIETVAAKNYVEKPVSEDWLKENGITKTVDVSSEIQPYYSLQEDGSVIETPQEVFDTLKLFGHDTFRYGQEKSIMRILSGLSTLVTLSTGSGKSLCYQLPAYLYKQKRKCVTIVISPLVSLMEDQVQGVASCLNAKCLHSYQSKKHFETVMEMAENGTLDILLISPEMLVSGENSAKIRYVLRQLPPIAFVCIDEAHCVSQWSHNFRPSYLMICKVIKEKLGVKTILGLTATSTLQTTESIVNHLEVTGGHDGVISDIPLPDNLVLSVSRDRNRDSALVNLLKSERFADSRSIIVYCTRRDECERIAGILRTSLQDDSIKPLVKPNKTKKRKRANWTAECYHAGVAAGTRKAIQKSFMSGELRIVVATIAFGMGINKADIGGVIHYNMPKSFESYVQEIGRAGRDGNIAHCHLFLDAEKSDQNELRRHVFANSMDRHVIRKLLQKVFVPCDCDKKSRDACSLHEVCFSVEETVQQLDIPEENIATLLCYLELHEDQLIQVLSKGYSKCKIISYRGPMQLRSAAKSCAPLAMAFALDLKKGISHTDSKNLEFAVIDVASAIGSDSGVVKFQLKNLEWTYENGSKKRSSLSVVFSELGFRMRSPGNLTDDQLNKTLDGLYNRVYVQEKNELVQLQIIFDALSDVASNTYLPCSTKETSTETSDKLKTYIREYFKNKISLDVDIKYESDTNVTDGQIINDIYTLISRYPENNFTGRAIARIFHGCQSPNYQAVIWGRCQLWRSYLKVDFNRIVNLANIEIVKMKTNS